jgi:AraC-like DNA-binding protein
MSPSLTLFLHGIGLGIGISLLAWHALPSNRLIPGRLALFAFIALLTLGFLLEAPSLMRGRVQLQDEDSLCLPFLPVSLWYYIRALVQSPVSRWQRHLVLPMLALACLLLLIALDGESWGWLEFIDARDVLSKLLGNEAVLMVASFSALVFWLVWLGLLAGYGADMLRSLRDYDRKLQDHYADPALCNRHRIRWLLGLTAITVCIALTDQILILADVAGMPDWLDSLFRLILLTGYGVLGLYEPPADAIPQAIPSSTSSQAIQASSPPPSYARSPLKANDCARLMTRVDYLMHEACAWQQEDLSLTSLAAQVGVRPDYLSQALNTYAGCNFFDYVNRYRIDKACHQLRETEDSILTICHAVGYNAKSTFNAAFKRLTGQTPSQYRRAASLQKV